MAKLTTVVVKKYNLELNEKEVQYLHAMTQNNPCGDGEPEPPEDYLIRVDIFNATVIRT